MHFNLKKLFVFFVCFSFMNVVRAETYDDGDSMCDVDYLKQLKNITDTIEITYEYVEKDEDKDGNYNVYVTGIDNRFGIIVNEDIQYNSINGEVTFKHGYGDVKIEVYSIRCDEIVNEFNLKLLLKNKFYNSNDCQELREYNLDVCKEWVNQPIDEEYYEDVIFEYIDDSENVSYEEEERLFYYPIIICGLIIFVIIFVVFCVRRRGRSILK